MPFPGVFPIALFTAAGKLTELTQVLSATDISGAAFTLPNGIQAGDLIVVWDIAFDTGGGVTAVTPGGFTNDVNVFDGTGFRGMLSHKIADGSEGGTSVNGMDEPDGEAKATYVFRGNVPITSVSVLGISSQGTTGNPNSQNVVASGGTPPLIVLGCYGGSTAVDPRTFSPAKDGEINATGGSPDAWLAYKIYNSSPADVSVDMDDEGTNLLASCYISCS